MKKVIVVSSDILGNGSEELGHTLMGSFLRKLRTLETEPEAIVFYNAGVKLLAKGSAVLDSLEALLEAGVELLACGTCVKYFGIEHKIHLGRVTDMHEIAAMLLGADSVVTV